MWDSQSLTSVDHLKRFYKSITSGGIFFNINLNLDFLKNQKQPNISSFQFLKIGPWNDFIILILNW